MDVGPLPIIWMVDGTGHGHAGAAFASTRDLDPDLDSTECTQKKPKLTKLQADQYTTGEEAAAKKASRSFKKYQYRGVELDQLLDMSNEKFIDVSFRVM